MRKSALSKSGSTSAWRKIRERVLIRDDYTCQRCGQYGDTVDHIVPRKLGGTDEDFNLQCMCRKCNYSKGGRFFESAPTPRTPHVYFIPKNDSISHYQTESD